MAVLQSITGLLLRVNTALLLVCKYLVILLVAIIAEILIASVFFRYGLNNSLSWAEELSKYLMVWLTFLGAPIALRHFGHINIDLLISILPARVEQFMYLIVSLVVAFTMGIVLWKGWVFTEVGARQIASTFNLSMLYLYIAVPIGAALTILVALEQALQALAGVFDPAKGLVLTHRQVDSAT